MFLWVQIEKRDTFKKQYQTLSIQGISRPPVWRTAKRIGTEATYCCGPAAKRILEKLEQLKCKNIFFVPRRQSLFSYEAVILIQATRVLWQNTNQLTDRSRPAASVFRLNYSFLSMESRVTDEYIGFSFLSKKRLSDGKIKLWKYSKCSEHWNWYWLFLGCPFYLSG